MTLSMCTGMWYYLSLFYCDKDLGMAYSWVSVGTAFSQVTPCLAVQQAFLPGLACMRETENQAAKFGASGSSCRCSGATHALFNPASVKLSVWMHAGHWVALGSRLAVAGWPLGPEGLAVAVCGRGPAHSSAGDVHPPHTG